MELPLLERRPGGVTYIFHRGRHYKREAGGQWSRCIGDQYRQVGHARARRLERLYRHPERMKPVRRFPRLPQNEPQAPIKAFFDIPLTTSLPRQEIRWLVDRLVPEGELVLITGVSGSLKSILVEALAAAVSQGRDFLERTTRQAMVLLLDGENPLHIIAQRRDTYHIVEGPFLRIWGNWQGSLPTIGDPRLLEMARDHHLLIIFDSLVRFHGADENSAKEMAPIMGELRKLVTAGATVIVVHHDTKAGKNKSKYRGSSDILAGVDVAFNLTVDHKTNPPTITVDCFKQRGMEEFTIKIRPDFEHGQFEVVADSTIRECEKIIEKLKGLIRAEPGLNQEQLIKRSGLPEHKVSGTLNAGEKTHWKVTRPKGKTKRYYPMDYQIDE
jgi:archaellum biogenesis ATPase FlaH